MQSASSAEKFSFIYFGSSQARAFFFFFPALHTISIYIYLVHRMKPLCFSAIQTYFFPYVCPIELPRYQSGSQYTPTAGSKPLWEEFSPHKGRFLLVRPITMLRCSVWEPQAQNNACLLSPSLTALKRNSACASHSCDPNPWPRTPPTTPTLTCTHTCVLKA